MSNITHVTSPDWEGIYVNGKLKVEGHILEVIDVLKALGINYNDVEADDEWLSTTGRLPENESEIKVYEIDAA